MLLVLMRIGPPGLYVHGRLTTSPSSVDGTVYRCVHTLPTILFGFAVPDLGVWLEVLSSHTHMHYYRHNYKHGKAAMTMHKSLITLFLFYSLGSVGLAGPEYFCR